MLMKEEILQLIKKEYYEIKEKKDNICNLMDKIAELEKNDIVREYLQLKEELQTIDYKNIMRYSDKNMIDLAYGKYSHLIDKTNGIYVYLGTYSRGTCCDIEHGTSLFRVGRNDSRANYREYGNLEKYHPVMIPIDKCEEFERNNKIIYLKGYFLESHFYKIQSEFIKDAVEYGQEEACKRVLSKKYE